MTGLLAGRVVIVTGGGRGLGRSHATCLAAQGAVVVVNDLGSQRDGSGAAAAPSASVVEEIVAAGGLAVADHSDVCDGQAMGELVRTTVERFGSLHAIVANAGILRDRMVYNMQEAEWSAVLDVHLTGTFNLVHHASRYWRARAKDGEEVDGRIVCTTSPSGLYGNVGQANYAAAKAGLVGFVLTVAQELASIGVKVNALSPGARTRMTEGLFDLSSEPAGVDTWAAENVSPALAWLLSDAAADLTGTVLEVENGWVGFALPWVHGPRVRREQSLWTSQEVTAAMDGTGAAVPRRCHQLMAPAGWTTGPESVVDADRVRAFAAAVGHPRESVPPTFAVTLTWDVQNQIMDGTLPGSGLGLHGEHAMRFVRHLEVGETVTPRATT